MATTSLEPHVRGPITADYSSIAATMFLLWDIILTMGDEILYIWPKPWTSWGKWLFFFVRYFALALQISLLFVGTQLAGNFAYTYRSCVDWYIYQEVAISVLIISVEFVLVIRVKALYHRNNHLIWILYSLFLAEAVGMSVSLAFAVPKVVFDSACVVIHSPVELVYFAAAYIAFETLLFVLTAYKFVWTLYQGWGTMPVLGLIVRDGTWAFALIFVTLVINVGFFLGESDSSMAAVAYSWIISVESLAGYRIILNLQSLEPRAASTLETPALSTNIRFTTSTNAPPIRRRARAGSNSGVLSRLETLRRGRMAFNSTTDSSTNDEFELTVTSASGSSGLGSSSRGERSWSDPSTSELKSAFQQGEAWDMT